MSRIAFIKSKTDVPAEHQDVFDYALKTFNGKLQGPFSVLLHSPELAQHFLGIVNYNRSKSVVSQQHRSLAALTAAAEGEGQYIWYAQARTARQAGFRDELIALIRTKGDPSGLPEEERDVVSYVQQFMRKRDVDRATFDTLQKRHGTKWLVELTLTAGFFGMLCGVVTTFEVPVPEGGEKLR
jgi:4-carboxymuconolactone decarboxylase